MPLVHRKSSAIISKVVVQHGVPSFCCTTTPTETYDDNVQVDDDAYCDVSSLSDLRSIDHEGREAVRDRLQDDEASRRRRRLAQAERARRGPGRARRGDIELMLNCMPVLRRTASKIGHMPVACMECVTVRAASQLFNCVIEKPTVFLSLYGRVYTSNVCAATRSASLNTGKRDKPTQLTNLAT